MFAPLSGGMTRRTAAAYVRQISCPPRGAASPACAARTAMITESCNITQDRDASESAPARCQPAIGANRSALSCAFSWGEVPEQVRIGRGI